MVTSSRLRYHALRVEAQFFLRLPSQEVPGTFDVGGGERLAVMPFDPVPELEGQLLAVLAPGPALGEVGYDRVERVLLLVLVEQHKVVEHRHQHGDRGARYFEAGLAKSGILRTPPDFCASAKWLPSQSASVVAAATAILRERLITAPPGRQLDRIFVAAAGFPPTSGGVKRLSRR